MSHAARALRTTPSTTSHAHGVRAFSFLVVVLAAAHFGASLLAAYETRYVDEKHGYGPLPWPDAFIMRTIDACSFPLGSWTKAPGWLGSAWPVLNSLFVGFVLAALIAWGGTLRGRGFIGKGTR